MIVMKKFKLLFLASLLVPVVSFAHTGHGIFDGGTLVHYLISPAHMIPILAGVILVAYYIVRKKVNATEKK